MESYDLIVIGGGPAGYLGAERAGHAGLKTLVIEKREFGGVCLNEVKGVFVHRRNTVKRYDKKNVRILQSTFARCGHCFNAGATA